MTETASDGTLMLDRPAPLPEVLDALIVGGGPAGTAAAFRAKELGLSALVIDYDDLMKRIRDYSEDKLILPSFGGGDLMQFPKGGELVRKLHFRDIDKDDMCRRWKGYYRSFGVPAQLGVELTGLEEEAGLWRIRCWNHSTKSEQDFAARHVVIGVGRGVPRRFDISGNVEGIEFRLKDAENQVGQPACVVGGGTSAAEAVIAISNAKARGDDPSAVYWSYRGERMPKVSRALADVFLEAFAGNGNIRYLPNSEPVSVFQAPDGQDYLCVRIVRKQPANRPVETIHLEFAKPYCIACIGEDLPVQLLASMGIHRVSGGPKNRQRLAVTPLLETARPNLYLAGDILSPAYLESPDLRGDPAGFREVKRRGNIKSALRDGVLVAEVIAQKLAGKTDIRVKLQFEDGPAQVEESRTVSGARLIRVQEGQVHTDEFPLRPDRPTSIGNRSCDINFDQDRLLSDRHAFLSPVGDGYELRNQGDSSVFLQPAAGRLVEVPDRAVLRAGNQWLVLGDPDNLEQAAHYDSSGREVQRFRLGTRPVVLGRQAADIVLKGSDGTLSRRHLSLSLRDGKRYLRDLESVNGTLLKVEAPIPIRAGDRIWMGRQVLEFNDGQEAAAPPVEVLHGTQPGVNLEEAVANSAGSEGQNGLTVRFQSLGRTLTLRRGQTICELAEEHGLKLTAQCRRGICGSDPIRIVSGHENLNPLGDGEEETLDDLCGFDDGKHRLACMARPTGPVVVEILD